MKLTFIAVIAAIVSASNGAVDVERTVQQVQSILKSNSLLPRLTRNEILQLLNDIREEDAKGISLQKIQLKDTNVGNIIGNSDNKAKPVSKESESKDKLKNATIPISTSTESFESTTNSATSKLAVVLPYTPRDGSSLQELYTRPPRVEIVPDTKATKKPINTLKSRENVKANKKLNDLNKQDFPQSFKCF